MNDPLTGMEVEIVKRIKFVASAAITDELTERGTQDF